MDLDSLLKFYVSQPSRSRTERVRALCHISCVMYSGDHLFDSLLSLLCCVLVWLRNKAMMALTLITTIEITGPENPKCVV